MPFLGFSSNNLLLLVVVAAAALVIKQLIHHYRLKDPFYRLQQKEASREVIHRD